MAEEEDYANYNQKEMIILLRGIADLLKENNQLLRQHNEHMRDVKEALRKLTFNTN